MPDLSPWSDRIDPATIPDPVLYAEVGRRIAAKRSVSTGGRNGGRPKLLRPCPRCGVQLGAVDLRRHKCPE